MASEEMEPMVDGTGPMADGTRPYLRDATVAIVPGVSDAQFERIHDELSRLNPFVLMRRLTGPSILVEGIPVCAGDPHGADVRLGADQGARGARARARPWSAAAGHSIDVRDPAGLLI